MLMDRGIERSIGKSYGFLEFYRVGLSPPYNPAILTKLVKLSKSH